MYQTKKMGASTIALVIVSVLLAMSLTLGLTLAYFYSADNGSNNIKFAGDFTISIDEGGAGTDKFPINLPGNAIIPGQQFSMSIKFKLTGKTSTAGEYVPVVLRASFEVEVSGYTPGTGDIMTLQQLNDYFNNSIRATISKDATSQWLYNGSHFYFVGHGPNHWVRDDSGQARNKNPGFVHDQKYVEASSTRTKAGSNKGSAPYQYFELDNDEALTSVYASNTGLDIDFLTTNDIISVPWELRNSIAGATVTVQVKIEALQDLIPGSGSNSYAIPTPATAGSLFVTAAGGN